MLDLMAMLQESVRAAQETRSAGQETPKGPGPAGPNDGGLAEA